MTCTHKCTDQTCHQHKLNHASPTAEHLAQVSAAAMGKTAEPMMMPMARYTQPRDRPILKRMTANTPDRMP